MSTGSPGRSDPASPAAGSGTLVVELPHWSAEVRVLDNLYQPVTGVLAGEGSDPAVKVSLPPGIYEVEVSLGARSARESVLVRPGRPVTLGREKWASLASTSAAPLAGTDSMREAHAAAAVEWSRKPLRSTSGSDSRLFVFVRTLEPKRYPQFAEGLRLLDADGREVADLSREGRRDAAQGWTAFCADLSAGLYILRRGRSGVRLRQQPVFLSAGWETQVFVAARNRPSLRTLMLNMAPRGAGFTPHDDAAAAAEVAMDALRLGPRGRHVVTGAHMEALLRGEHQNPWLAILAAYALRARQEDDREDESTGLLRDILDFLARVVPDHPDARALRLELREPLQPAGTFPHPPLLRAGLRRVQTQATRFADAIPPGSLTDRVFEVVLANSVWTAWRRLSEPRPSRAAAVAATAPPRAPVFRLAGRGTGAVDDAPTQLLHDLPLLETARTLTPHTALDDIPEQLVLDPGERLRHMLESIEPEHISLASGVPLSRATLGLEHLRGRCATLSMTSSDAAQPLTRAEYVVLEYVLGTAASADQAASASPADAPADEPAPTAVVAGTVDPLSLEEGVRALREAAGRLEESATQQERTPAEKEWALETAARLRRVSVRLLSLGELVAITDGDGRLLYGNQAFAALLSDPEGGPGERGAGEGGAWEHALASAPVGSSTLRTPLQDPYAGEWKLRRTTVMDEPASAARAYLNVLRAPTERPEDTAARVLPELEALLPELTLFASLFAGGESRRDYYVQRLHELADRVEAMPLDAGGAPTPEAAGAEAAVEA